VDVFFNGRYSTVTGMPMLKIEREKRNTNSPEKGEGGGGSGQKVTAISAICSAHSYSCEIEFEKELFNRGFPSIC
jgi:hypothetical protein